MDYLSPDLGSGDVRLRVSRFRGKSGVEEIHLTAEPTRYADARVQLGWLERAWREALAALGLDERSALFRRVFATDPVNQAAELDASPLAGPQPADNPCAISRIGQPPLPPAKVALWACHLRDPAGPLDKQAADKELTLTRGSLTHHWMTRLARPDQGDSHDQTAALLRDYDARLRQRGLSLPDHLVRTWLYVRDIDTHYAGMVEARKNLFAQWGLTADTHYVASSGIEGVTENPAVKVAMDAWSIGGLQPAQVEHLEALDHLSPTHVYGVTFERATALTFADRKHILISGTASIDHTGEVVHPGDVGKQLDRTLENVAALLEQAHAGLDDVASFLVYLRDPSDHQLIRRRLEDRFGDLPMQIVVG
ncbi:MAG: Rid family hydrolase, partial [Phycisphaeraceae bacterium]